MTETAEKCEHKTIEEASEIDLFEEKGLSVAEIHSRKWYFCENCGALVYLKEGKRIEYFGTKEAENNGWRGQRSKSKAMSR